MQITGYQKIITSLVVMQFTIHHKKMMMEQYLVFLFSEGLYFVERVNQMI